MAETRAQLTAEQRAIASLEEAQQHEPGLNLCAAQLLTFNGYVNALANLAERAKAGGDRDENASMNVEVKALKMFQEIHASVLTFKLDSEGNAKLAELESLIGRKESGASTSFDQDYDPPTITHKGPN